jgi:phospholipid transport system substrate-binding protein
LDRRKVKNPNPRQDNLPRTKGRRSTGLAMVCLCLLVSFSARAQTHDAMQASQAIDRFQTSLISVMQSADGLGYAGRYRRLQPEIENLFDFRTMTRVISGPAWNSWDDAKRDRLADAFRDFVTATYARRFDGYAGEHFSIDAQQPVSGGILVKTRLVRTAEPPVELDYLTHDTGRGPQVVDVFLAGTISELATRRSEFSAVLRRDGYDGLLAALRVKTND